MAAPINPRVEKICQNVDKSYEQLNQLIDGRLATLEHEKLYMPPTEKEWTIMQNLSHTVEFMPYWAGQIKKLVAEPGCGFGRLPEDEQRLMGIDQHKSDSLKQMRAALLRSYTQLKKVLDGLQDSDLEIKGLHARHAEKTLDWFIENFVTKHLNDHVSQIENCLEILA